MNWRMSEFGLQSFLFISAYDFLSKSVNEGSFLYSGNVFFSGKLIPKKIPVMNALS
jgi:hypothetical protein